MKVRLELVHKNAKLKKVWLKADTIIGRSTECGLRIASNEVSRQHCKICLGDEGVTVRDLGSSNGTFVNGYQLEPETDYEIAPDSELSVGGIKFFVRFQEPAAKLIQSDGLGSTIDLKPEHPPVPERAESAGPAEDMRPADPEETPTVPEPVAISETGTIQMSRPRNGDSVTQEPDFEISAHGDSAILEREEGNIDASEADEPQSADQEQAVDAPFDEGPETKEVPYERLMEEAKKAGLAGKQRRRSKDEESETSKSATDKPADADVAAFLEQVADEETEISDDDESLGDFFKQLD